MEFKPKGIIAALITPTDANGKLKERASRNIIKYVIDGGVHGLFAVGTAGEFYAIDKKTKMRITEIAVEEAAGKLPIYIGATSNTTRESIDLAEGAESIGANAVTVLTPSFVKCRDDELYDHFKAIANSISLPVILYSLPGTTGVGISPKLLGELCRIDNIVGIKDSSGDLSITEQYIRQASDNFSVLSGRDTLILATLMYGGAGGVAATANVVPGLVASIYTHYMDGNIEKAREAQFKLAPLRHAFGLGSTSAAMLKAAVNLKGMDVGETVAPVKLLGERELEQLREILKEMGD
jgi:4-hydroxy-tetrahydrodipicolinate synthase